MKLPYYETFSREHRHGVRYYFTLHAGNGEAICQSEGYITAAGRDKGVNSVRRNAPFARVVESKNELSKLR